MDIYRKKIEPFWPDKPQPPLVKSPSLSKKDIQKIFRTEKRKLNFKPIGLTILILAIFWLGLVAFSIPRLTKSIAYAQEGAEQLGSGLAALAVGPDLSRQYFIASSQSLKSAASMLKSLGDYAKVLLALPQAQSSLHLMRAANHLAAVGADLTLLVEGNQPNSPSVKTNTIETILTEYLSKTDTFLAEKSEVLARVVKRLNQANQEIQQANFNHLPKNQKAVFAYWQKNLPGYGKIGNAILALTEQKDLIFGSTAWPKKYLVLFQNDTELRPSGGFLGSYGTLTIAGNQVTEWWVQKNIYTQDKAFAKDHKIEPPLPLKKLTGEWVLRDSNWALDFPSAAKKVAEFYELEGGTKVDGVIAIDTTIVEDLLKLTGPIQVPGYDFTVDAASFVENTQKQVELDYYENPENKMINQPKTYLDDLSAVIAAAINSLDQEKKGELTKILAAAAKRKSLLISLFEPNLASALKDLNVDGHLENNQAGDYLYIANANIGGKKSSRNVWQEANLISEIKSDSSIQHRLTITRQHKGDGKWPDGDNNNWTQILLPKGSKLIKSQWQGTDKDGEIEVSQYLDKTLFSFWFNTPVGQKKSLTIHYQIPNLIKDDQYNLLVQKQPGAQNATVIQQIKFPRAIKKFEGSADLDKTAPNSIKTKFKQNSDSNLAVEF